MANFFEDNQDCKYYLEKWIDWEPLVRFTEYDFKAEDGFTSVEEAVEFYRDILHLVGKFSANEIAPRVEEIDASKHELSDGVVVVPEPVQQIFDGIKELDLHGMCLPRELGGMNCPLLIYYMNSELIGRAETAVMSHHSFHGGIAMAMLMYSILEGSTKYQVDPPKIVETRFADQIADIARGDAWGSMDITEPDAGSDMGALRCKGEQDADGNWYVTGQKIFITSGHGKYHFVVARTEKSKGDDSFEGLKGLSLFLVPSYEGNGVGDRKWLASIEGLEKKMGHHGSATVSAQFDRTPAMLVGQRGDGFKLMLLLMNTARIAVGFESLGLCESAYRLAKEYAAQRPSMGKMIDRHEMIAGYLEEMETDIQAIRALSVYAGYHEEMAQKLRMHLYAFVDEDAPERKELERKQKEHQQKSRAVTPLLKYFASESAVEIARRAIQIHGGVGYTTEYGAEKLMRDALVFPIYEGTSQIQSLMAMKDNLMRVMKQPQTFLREMASARTRSLTGRDEMSRRVAKVQFYCLDAIKHLIVKVAAAKVKDLRHRPMGSWWMKLSKDWDPKRDFAPAMLHAERLTILLTDKAIAEILLDQATRHPERREVLVRFLERAEPRAQYMHNVITTTGPRFLKRLSEEEGLGDRAN